MKKFFFRAFLFVTPFLLVALFVEIKLRGIKNSYTTKKTNIEENGTKINTLIMGDSHSLFGINPEYFYKPAFNLAHLAQSIYFDEKLISIELSNLPNLKNVILPISYYSLYYNMKDGKEKQRVYAYYQFWRIKSQEFKYTDFDNYSLISLLTSESVIKIAKNGFKSVDQEGSTNNLSKLGFISLDSVGINSRVSDSLGKEKYTSHASLIKMENLVINEAILDKLISTLNDKGINVYLVSTPTYKTYYQYLDTSIVLKNQKSISRMCNKFKIIYLDFTKDSRFTKQDFYDNDHLNKYGAKKFSIMLDSIIENKQ